MAQTTVTVTSSSPTVDLTAASATDEVSSASATTTASVTSAGSVALPVRNVENYGAVHDGSTNDSTAIQAAIASLDNGGIVYLPPGTYAIATAIAPTEGVWLVGAGRDATTLLVTGTNRGISVSNTPNVRIYDLTVDCDSDNTTDNGTTTQHGIFFSSFSSTGCPGAKVVRCRVKDAWDRGIIGAASTLTTHPLDVDVIDCEVSGHGAAGIFIQNATRTLIQGCDVFDNGLWGIHVAGGTNAVIRGNRAHDQAGTVGSRGHGIVVNTAHVGAIIDGNICYGNTLDSNTWGIVIGINTTRFIVSNNYCYGNSQNITIDPADTVTNPIETRGVVANNICTASTVGNGLNFVQVDGVTIVGNHCSHNTQTGLEIYGRNCVVSGNISHHNGRHGISFQEDATGALETSGPHRYFGNYTYDNNTSAGAWLDYVSEELTNGPVLADLEGTGDPDGVHVAGIGSTFRRTDGGAATSFYVKESGTDSSGWVAK